MKREGPKLPRGVRQGWRRGDWAWSFTERKVEWGIYNGCTSIAEALAEMQSVKAMTPAQREEWLWKGCARNGALGAGFSMTNGGHEPTDGR